MKRIKILLAVSLCCFCFSAWAGDEKSTAPAAEIYNKAVHLYQTHHWDAAKEYFHQYLAEYSETPLYTTCLYYLAYCYQQLKDTEEAILIYNKVIDHAQGEEAFWGQMAQKRIEEIAP